MVRVASEMLRSQCEGCWNLRRIPHFLGECETDRFDRYVSTGSLEYWPDLAQGVRNGLFGSCSRNAVAMRNENDIEFRSVNII